MTPTGAASPSILRYDCAAGESCAIVSGKAQCLLTAACREESTRCASAATLETCNGGRWMATTCPNGCNGSSLGSFCAPTSAKKELSAKVVYEARAPNAELTDWSTRFIAPAPGFMVLSYAGGELLDAATTDGTGGFSIDVPSNPAASDFIAVVLAADDGAGGIAFAVVNPRFTAPGTQDMLAAKPNASLWAYSFPTSSIAPSSTLTITEQMGSGAARVYDYLRYAYAVSRERQGGRSGLSLVIWLGYGTSWTCGACFAPIADQTFGLPFQAQMWLPADSNQSYWADAVTGHELGHWSMASYGTSPTEGGPHSLSRPTFPGQAWSEGFATWFSSDLRKNSFYIDKQQGAMFWLNLDTRGYSPGVPPWTRPSSSLGLHQLLDENEVSAMLWRISHARPWGTAAVDRALSSQQLNTSPFTRGYTRHAWEINNEGQYVNVVDTKLPRPMVADFLDALVCGGFPPAAVDAATEPATAYPYPSQAPLCSASSCSRTCNGCCLAGTCQPGNLPTACGSSGGACEACTSGQVCSAGSCR